MTKAAASNAANNVVLWTRPKGLWARVMNWRLPLKSSTARALEAELMVTQSELKAALENAAQLRDKLNVRNEEFERRADEMDNTLSSLEIPMVMVDRALRITKFNRAAHLLFNISNDDVGFPITQVRCRFEIPFLNSKLLKVMEQAEPLHRKISDSQMGAFKQSIVPYRDARNHVQGAILSFTPLSGISDGTDRTLESASLFRAAQRMTGLGSWYWPVGMEEVYWSDQLYSIYGTQPGAVRPTLTRFIESFHPDDRATLRSEIATALQHKRGFSAQLRVQRADGTATPVQVEAMYQRASLDERQSEVLMGLIRDLSNTASNTNNATTGVGADITAGRAQTAAAPATQNAANSANAATGPAIDVENFVDAINEPLAILAMDGTVRLINSAASSMFGYDNASLAGESVNTLLAARSNNGWFKPVARTDSTVETSAQIVATLPLTGLTRDGQGVPMTVSVCYLPQFPALSGDNQENGALIATFRDRAEEKKLQNELKAAQKTAREAARALEAVNNAQAAANAAQTAAPATARAAATAGTGAANAVIATVTQAIDPNLSLIADLAAIVSREVHGPIFNRRYKECAGEIEARSNRMRATLTALENLEQIRSNQYQAQDSVIELRDMIADAIEAHSSAAHAKEISLGLDITPALPNLWADRNAVAQILNSMMDYALDATGEGENVTLRITEGNGAANAESQPQTGKGKTRAAQAQPAGMEIALLLGNVNLTQAQKDAAFDPYKAAAMAGNDDETDTALANFTAAAIGLTLAQQYAAQMGGALTLTQDNDNTARLSFTVPARRIAAESANATETTRRAG